MSGINGRHNDQNKDEDISQNINNKQNTSVEK